MKLNNKGFAITAVLYGLLILFVVLVSSYLLVLSAKKDRVDTLVNEIEKNYKTVTLRVGDYVEYTPTLQIYSTDTTITGYPSSQDIYPYELNLWRVLRINNDNTVEIISEYVSSTEVHFQDLIGYQNLVGYLNVLASKYETEGITVDSRHFGYNGQTEYIEDINEYEPWTCSTGESCNPVESEGGGDTLYLEDYNQLYTALGTRVANKVGTTTATKYWVSSRLYSIDDDYKYMDRYIDENGNLSKSHLSDGDKHWYSVRPILTLTSNLKYTGRGTSENPYRIIT